MVGCPPCQPFSMANPKRVDNKCNDYSEDCKLLLEFGRLIKEVRPEIIAMENVPEMKKARYSKSFSKRWRKKGTMCTIR